MTATRTFLLKLVVMMFMAVLLLPTGLADTVTYPVVSETVTKGTSTGFANEAVADSSSDTKMEASSSTLGPYSPMLLPTGDVAVQWTYAKYTTPPCPVGTPATHAGTLTCPTPGGTLEPDGNTSFITAEVNLGGPVSQLDRYTLTSLSIPAGSTIASVTAFAWVRENESGVQVNLNVGCNDGTADGYPDLIARQPTLAFVNYSFTWGLSCSGDAWKLSDFLSLQYLLVATDRIVGISHETASYVGVIVTYSTPTDYVLDISQTVNVPTEQVNQVEIFLSCSLAGDTESLNLQIQGVSYATGLCIAPYVDTSYKIDYRGDVVVRLYNSPDVTQTSYSIDLLVAVVTTSDGGGQLKPPIITCSYNAFTQNFDCVDTQEYGQMRVSWVRWKVDGGNSIKGQPDGRVSLPSGNDAWSAGSRTHYISATAVYASGGEATSSITMTSDDGVRLVLWFLIAMLIIIAAVVIVDKRRKK